MPNFSALIVFESSVAGGSKDRLYEERVYLVEAVDAEEAWNKAQSLAQREGVSFENVERERVRWAALGVIGVEEIHDDAIAHGTELFSRYLHDLEAYGKVEPRARGLIGDEAAARARSQPETHHKKGT